MKSYKVSAPGSMMLMGEHSVLKNKFALVAALNRRMKVELALREDNKILIKSELGSYESELNNFSKSANFTFISEIISEFQNQISSGFEIIIKSNMPHNKGYGSSASVTAATLACFDLLLKGKVDNTSIFNQGLNIIRKVQSGLGSGSDLLASIYGGINLYKVDPFSHKRIELKLPIVLVNSGVKVPTPEVIKYVNDKRALAKDYYNQLDCEIDSAVTFAFNALEQNNLEEFYKQLKRNQELMKQLGVSTEKLEELIEALDREPSIFASKISGSGLGDCVYGLGSVTSTFPFSVDQVEVDFTGLKIL